MNLVASWKMPITAGTEKGQARAWAIHESVNWGTGTRTPTRGLSGQPPALVPRIAHEPPEPLVDILQCEVVEK